MTADTPMMQQFRAAKTQHPGMLVLFRNGDFYELFEGDAELGSRLLGLTLTKRDQAIPMAGFPVHKLEHYLNLLLRAGHRVAVCEQMEAAGTNGAKIIRREVNRVVTPAPSPRTNSSTPAGRTTWRRWCGPSPAASGWPGPTCPPASSAPPT